ncbi:MAG TPA: hypothetical protein VJ774_00250 [Actinomycetota bacterium]|nr:hypothetical protein [Actinomycetota bacterium]
MSTHLDHQLRETLTERQAGLHPSPLAPEDLLRRARRRVVSTVLVGVVSATALVAISIAAIEALVDGTPDRVPGGEGDPTVLPTEGPAPGETSLLLASGEHDGEPWALRVTSSPRFGYGLSFEYEALGGGGGGIEPMRQGRIFQGYGGSSSPDYPDNDRTRPPLPIGLSGQVAVEAERVELLLEHGPVVDAALYALPDDLVGPAKVFLLFIPGDTLLVAGDLVAYDGSGAELDREYFDMSPVSLFPKVLEESPSQAIRVMKDLQLAGAVVGRYFDTHGSYSGLDPDSASAISSEVVFNDSPVAIPGEVSIRVSGPQSLVLASATPDGAIYSACMEGPGVSVYGRNDTSDPHRCTNGWLDPSADPPPVSGNEPIATGSDPNGNLWSLTLLDVGGPGAETPFELELLIGPIGASLPLQPLGNDDVGSIGAVPPTATPENAPAPAGLPTSVWGVASDRVASVELRLDDGSFYQGELYRVPTGSIDAEQAFLILVPIEGPMMGTIVALDSGGDVLQRKHVESSG